MATPIAEHPSKDYRLIQPEHIRYGLRNSVRPSFYFPTVTRRRRIFFKRRPNPHCLTILQSPLPSVPIDGPNFILHPWVHLLAFSPHAFANLQTQNIAQSLSPPFPLTPTQFPNQPIVSTTQLTNPTQTPSCGRCIHTVTIPRAMLFIPPSCFENSAIYSILIEKHSRLQSIGEAAFRLCASLSSLVLPETLYELGPEAFARSSLQMISLHPKCDLKTISEYCFQGCARLQQIILPSSLRIIKRHAFYQSGVRRIQIPEGVQTIEASAFSNCLSLRSVEIPTSLLHLEDSAFTASGLTTVTFAKPSSLTSIPSNAFSACRLLKKITIPSSVETIFSRAFSRTALENVLFDDDSKLGSIHPLTFEGCMNVITISIPSKIENLFRTTFKEFIIEEASSTAVLPSIPAPASISYPSRAIPSNPHVGKLSEQTKAAFKNRTISKPGVKIRLIIRPTKIAQASSVVSQEKMEEIQ